MNKTAVIIARFQTPYLHEGHKHLLEEIRKKHNKIVVVLGISQVQGSIKNPFDFYTREKMLKIFMPELVVIPLSDEATDRFWSVQLDTRLKTTFPGESFLLYGSRDSFIPYYTGTLKVVELPEYGDHNATELRTMNSDHVLDTDDFRLGINYAFHNTFPKVFPTVDIAVYNENHTQILLGKKYGQDKWRLPGGFTDPADDSYEEAAHRELMEECGKIEVSKMKYKASLKINDWRYKNERDKIITHLFVCHLIFGKPEAGDDLQEVGWFEVSKIAEMMIDNDIVPEHVDLLSILIASMITTY